MLKKIEKNLPLGFEIYLVSLKLSEIFFQILWTSQNILTLPYFLKMWDIGEMRKAINYFQAFLNTTNMVPEIVHVLSSRFYSDFILILSRFYPDFVQIWIKWFSKKSG
jgi:hypothetical protein